MDTGRLPPPTTTVLTRDPNTVHRLNCNSFQQHGLTTAFGWQYATFYVSDSPEKAESPRYVCIARRRLPQPIAAVENNRGGRLNAEAGAKHDVNGNNNTKGLQNPKEGRNGDEPAQGLWQRVVLRDYAQTTEDGHNTISMGISEGDGRIHLVWDLHNDLLRYRRSIAGLASSGEEEGLWDENAFGAIQNGLPGTAEAFRGKEATYPRFVGIGNGEMLFECRLGRAGAGDAALCKYTRHDGADGDNEGPWKWTWMGVYLKGEDCSPYINWIHYDDQRHRLWVTWTNRRFTELQREGDKSQVSQQAGPNGPENNEDLGCLFSDDGGVTWQASDGLVLTGTAGADPPSVNSRDRRAIARKISRDSGIMNQEAQCVDTKGRIHVLMRDSTTIGGPIEWKHHYQMGSRESWSSEEIPSLVPTGTGSRGKICCDPRTGDIWFMIPGNFDTSLTLLRRKFMPVGGTHTRTEQCVSYGPFETMWVQLGFDGEPLIDEERLWKADGQLSLMTRTAKSGTEESWDVVVLDWHIAGL